ncbi:transglycosylase SLT domain-containing protein [Xanthomonas phaseoli]|uniref:transglycosylase SLT domain-containing protein n=1 Tax=Xanthomonas phaseoli TaxID=1985254 RepID=UPI001ED9131C|nr:transglycosylase SLT domain-containing protein [Xanthomonas phaseoli]
MPFLDLPTQMQERVVCSITAAVKYEVPANIVLAVAEQEAGKPGQWVENTNGTQDVGPMQFNTAYMVELRKYGITAQDVARGGCYSYDLAAWRLRGHLRNDQGDIWTRAANYHSRTPQYNAVYRAALIKRANKWENWLVARFPTFDATQPGKPVVAAVAAADATPGAGQGATAPATPARRSGSCAARAGRESLDDGSALQHRSGRSSGRCVRAGITQARGEQWNRSRS